MPPKKKSPAKSPGRGKSRSKSRSTSRGRARGPRKSSPAKRKSSPLKKPAATPKTPKTPRTKTPGRKPRSASRTKPATAPATARSRSRSRQRKQTTAGKATPAAPPKAVALKTEEKPRLQVVSSGARQYEVRQRRAPLAVEARQSRPVQALKQLPRRTTSITKRAWNSTKLGWRRVQTFVSRNQRYIAYLVIFLIIAFVVYTYQKDLRRTLYDVRNRLEELVEEQKKKFAELIESNFNTSQPKQDSKTEKVVEINSSTPGPPTPKSQKRQ